MSKLETNLEEDKIAMTTTGDIQRKKTDRALLQELLHTSYPILEDAS